MNTPLLRAVTYLHYRDLIYKVSIDVPTPDQSTEAGMIVCVGDTFYDATKHMIETLVSLNYEGTVALEGLYGEEYALITFYRTEKPTVRPDWRVDWRGLREGIYDAL